MEHVDHLTYGWINPVMGFGFAFAGSLLALMCMTQARAHSGTVKSTGKRLRWIGLAAFALGGTAIWMMHFTAMIGFKVIESDIAYDPLITTFSLVASIGAVFLGLVIAGMGRRNTIAKILMAGPLTGLGVVVMHYAGMKAINISGQITYERAYFMASVVIAVVAATAALACGMYLDGWKWQSAAAIVMAVAISGMHYTGMAGVRVSLSNEGRNSVVGLDPIMLILPILGVATVGIIVLLFALMGTTPKTTSRREQLGIELDEDDLTTAIRVVPKGGRSNRRPQTDRRPEKGRRSGKGSERAERSGRPGAERTRGTDPRGADPRDAETQDGGTVKLPQRRRDTGNVPRADRDGNPAGRNGNPAGRPGNPANAETVADGGIPQIVPDQRIPRRNRSFAEADLTNRDAPRR